MNRNFRIGGLLLLAVVIPQGFRVISKNWDLSFEPSLVLQFVIGIPIIVLVVLILPGLINRKAYKEIETLRREKVLAGERVLLDDIRPYFLYLRAFGADNTRVSRSLFHQFTLGVSVPQEGTYEETIVALIKRECGPVVAIGEPGTEVLPPLGAGRFWFEDDVWQEEVENMMARAEAIIFVLGETIPPGLSWELEQAFERGGTPILLVLSPGLTGREVRLQALKTALGERWVTQAEGNELTDAALTVVSGTATPKQYSEAMISWPSEPLEKPIIRALRDLGLAR